MIREKVIHFIRTYHLFLAWFVSVVSLCGSLYLSEILGLEPCKLCWFQRICMYPLAILLGIATYRNDRTFIPYARTLSVIGMCISLLHYLEQKVPGLQNVLPCSAGVPCSETYINGLGFITIPFLAMLGFLMITILLSVGKKND
jgi:disulfide bond formation protein DsbB